MKVKMMSGEEQEVSTIWGARMIEQGQAILLHEEKKASKAEKKAAREAAAETEE